MGLISVGSISTFYSCMRDRLPACHRQPRKCPHSAHIPRCKTLILTAILFGSLFSFPQRVFAENAEVLLGQAEEAILADDYEAAADLVRRAFVAARTARNPDLQADVAEMRARISVLQRKFNDLRDARMTLSRSPSDAEANALLGLFYCFDKEHWKRGLPMLAKGGDEALRSAALVDISTPDDLPGQARLGELWLAIAEQHRDGEQRDQMFLRARHWLLLALEQATNDAQKDAIGRRLDKVQLNPSKVIIYNTHNGPMNNRGTLLLDLVLLQDEKPVFTKRIPMVWLRDVSAPNIVRLTGRTPFNHVRMTVLKWEGFGGGLAELEVYQGKTNLALHAFATGDSSPLARCRPGSLTDGDLGSNTDQNGLWMLNNSTPGTVDVYLNRR